MFENYWKTIMMLKPIKDGQKITMSKEQFKHMLEQSYNKGKNEKSIFEQIFGGK